MTFHKAKEESKWKQWKEQEERILRKSGVSEEVIQRLRELDWQDFNAERRFWEHFSSNQEELYTRELEEPSSVVLNIQQLLDSVHWYPDWYCVSHRCFLWNCSLCFERGL